MKTIAISLSLLIFSVTTFANSDLIGRWKGITTRTSSGYSCSSPNNSDLFISTDQNYLYVDLKGGCSTSPMTKIFEINGNAIYLGSKKVGYLNKNQISIERLPGRFGGPKYVLQIYLTGSVVKYLEIVEGSSQDFSLIGEFILIKDYF